MKTSEAKLKEARKAYRKAYEQTDKRKAYQKAYQKAYREAHRTTTPREGSGHAVSGKARRDAFLIVTRAKKTQEDHRAWEQAKKTA